MPPEVLGVQDRLTAWMPAPETTTLDGELDAVLATVTVPLVLPEPVGANVTLRLAFCPATNVYGKLKPPTLNPAPVTVAWVMVTAALPVFVTTTGRMASLPRITLPNARLPGLAETWPDTAVPVPESATFAGEPVALLTTETLPVTLPLTPGVNVTRRLPLLPAGIVRGTEMPLTLNAAPLTVTSERVTLAVPVFVKVINCALTVPTATLPNATFVGLMPSNTVPVPARAPLVAPQMAVRIPKSNPSRSFPFWESPDLLTEMSGLGELCWMCEV